MKRTTATGSIDGAYQDRNTALGREGTLLTAEDRNAIQEELCAVIEASGQVLNGADLAQLLKAVALKLGDVAETISGVKTFSSIPVLPASAPTTADQATRKGYVDGLDAQNVKTTGAQTVAGVKTFSSIPVGPASNPTNDNQLARKAYVDSTVSSGVSAHADLTDNPHSVTASQLGLGTTDTPTFASITTASGPNKPVDNNDASMPTIGVGGFTYGVLPARTANLSESFTLPVGGTHMYHICVIGRNEVYIGRGSGGSSTYAIAGNTGEQTRISVWRIA
jgi:uncharacterized protein YunC (DUF1805 family)